MKKQQFDLSNKCVECTTRKQFIEVLKWHEKMGHRWNDKDRPMDGIDTWDIDCDCLDIFDNFGICDKEWNEDKGLTVLSFEEFKHDYLEPIYVHKKSGDKYEVVGECKTKDILTGQWFDSVMYNRIGEETVYVREKIDFYEKFEVLVDGKDEK